jgi:arsenate reductase-like glutaredoxin family protein
MKFIYTKKMCSACDALKEKLREAGTPFAARSGDRFDLDPQIFDDVDREAFLKFQMQNLTFPVEVDILG